jgi:flavin reductase (DIM6/NTAB) family NADH-FMN oxidoreductase RutF
MPAAAAREVTPATFRDALGHFCTGVTVVTASAPSGPVGFACQAFTAVSLDPPLVLFSLDRRAYSLWDFLSTGHFAVNVLAEDQGELSTRFARPMSDKWSGVRWATWDHGCPILLGCHANFECSIAYTHAGGDHVIFVGQVERMGSDAEKAPLLYYRGGYRSLASA